MGNKKYRLNHSLLVIIPPAEVKRLSVGVGFLCSVLDASGVKFDVCDMNNNHMDFSSLVDRIRQDKPYVLGFSVHSSTAMTVYAYAKKLRKLFPERPFLMGGPEMISEYRPRKLTCLENTVVVSGNRSSDITNALKQLGFPTSIAKPLPVFAYNLVPNYCWIGGFFTDTILRQYPIITSYGCNNQCSFCFYSSDTKKYRWHPRKLIVFNEEIRRMLHFDTCGSITVWDSNFNQNYKFSIRCIDEKMSVTDMPWRINGFTLKNVDKYLIKKLRESNCKSVSIGVESLDLDVQKQIGSFKQISEFEYKEKINMLKENNINTVASFVIGLQNDTFEKTMYTYQKAAEIGFDVCRWSFAIPFPGTPLHKYVTAKCKVFKSHLNCRFQLSTLTDDKIFNSITFESKEYPRKIRFAAYCEINKKQPFVEQGTDS